MNILNTPFNFKQERRKGFGHSISIMGNLLGKSRQKKEKEKEQEQAQQVKMQAKISSEDKALLDLKNSRDKLKRFQKRSALESQKLEYQIRDLLKQKNKQKAILLLKFKKVSYYYQIHQYIYISISYLIFFSKLYSFGLFYVFLSCLISFLIYRNSSFS